MYVVLASMVVLRIRVVAEGKCCVFLCRKIETAEEKDQEAMLLALIEKYGKDSRKYSRLLQKWVVVNAAFNPGTRHDFFHEWFNALPELVVLSETR